MNDYKPNRETLIQNQKDMYGYNFCQHCGMTSCGPKLEVHHIVFRSEAPNHENLHHINNLVILGTYCHKKFHDVKSSRNFLIKERGLNSLFGKNLIIEK